MRENNRKRARWAMAVTGLVLLSAMFLNAAFARPGPKNVHGIRIAELENKTSLSSTEAYDLGYQHMIIADFYASLARSAALLTMGQARCYADDPFVEWGAEYFGALAALELNKPDTALAFCKRGGARKSAPRPLRDLTRILRKAAETRQVAKAGLVWNSFNPGTYWDSLEVYYQVTAATGHFPLGNFSIDLRRPRESGVSLAPLVTRMQLARYLAGKRKEELRRLLRRFESEGLPLWSIKSPHSRDTAVFSDPALLRLVVNAHYMLAEIDFARAVAASNDREQLDKLRLNWMKVCFKRRNHQRADSLLAQMPDLPRLLPYRGWVAWQRGDTNAVWEYWNNCLDPKEYKIAADLLRIWATIPELREHAYSLIESLSASLGGVKDQYRLRHTKDGRSRLLVVYRSIGAWYFANEIYDSASYFYERTRTTNDPVNHRFYRADFCAEYFSARTFSGKIDLRQGGYEGWIGLGEYFPIVRSVTWPLEEIMFCETRGHLE